MGKIFFRLDILVKLALVLYLSLFFSGCENNSVAPVPPVNPILTGVYVVNEGLYSQNNSSLTFYDKIQNRVYQSVYSGANGKKLGDTANDLEIIDSLGLISVDNSNKIEVVSLTDFKSKGFVDLGPNASPRDICIMNKNDAFVTCGGRDEVVRFNPNSLQITGSVRVGSKPEGILNFGDNLYVANSGFGFDSTISIIEYHSQTLQATLEVGLNPRILLKDSSFVYAVCSGKYDAVGLGGIYKIDPVNSVLVDMLPLDGNPGEACLSENYLYVVNNSGVVKISLDSFSIENNNFIAGMTVNPIFGVIYSIAYDEQSNRIYCGNPKDFQQNGEIVIFEDSGNEVSRFDSGINPGVIKILD